MTVKFWQLATPPDGVPFSESLKIALGAPIENSMREIDGGFYQFQGYSDPSDDVMLGDVIRLQSEALPSLVEMGQKAKKLTLAENQNLGHHTGFIYEPERRLLGFEIKPSAAGLVKLLTLVAALAKHPTCIPLPVLTSNALQALAGTKNGVIRIKVADPASLTGIDPELTTMRDNLTFLKDMVDGAYVYLAIGVGPRRDGLAPQKLMKLVGWLLGERDAKRGKVRAIKVQQPHEEEGLLDFIKAQYKNSDVLQLTGDPETDWAVRQRFLQTSLAKAKAHVRKHDDA